MKTQKKKNKKKFYIYLFLLLLFCSPLGWILIIFIIAKGEEFLLKKYGCRTKAIVTSRTLINSRAVSTPHYVFEFFYDDKFYEGNSLIEVKNKERVGDTIEVVFLKFLPERNRPIYFWNEK